MTGPPVYLFTGFYCGPMSELPPPPSDEMIPGWAAVGESADDVAEQIGELLETEVDSIVLVPFGDPQSQLELAATEILPQLT